MKMIGSQMTAKYWIEFQVEPPPATDNGVTPKLSPLPRLKVRVEGSTVQARGSSLPVSRAKCLNAVVASEQSRRERLDTPMRYSLFLNWSEPIRPSRGTSTVGEHSAAPADGTKKASVTRAAASAGAPRRAREVTSMSPSRVGARCAGRQYDISRLAPGAGLGGSAAPPWPVP